jgi:hypothetical protein
MMTLDHHWVKHTITPVHTVEGNDGRPVVFVDPDQQIIAEDNAVYGCDICGQAMVTVHDEPCAGVPADVE